jgi:endonuclease/exonuclease/phosphatase family metal-dependent hydrolase
VKVLSWNIERGLRLPDVTEILRRHGASLVLLQEVDLNSRRTGRRNIAEELARSLRMPYLFAAEFEELGQGSRDSPAYHGQAILTSLTASSPRIIRFEHQTGFWRPRSYLPNWPVFQRRTGGRLALVAEVDVAGRRLVVYNAHLESRGSEQLRKVQIEEILADSRRYPADAPILIAGDFNTRRTSTPAIAALLQAGFRMAVGQQVTTTRGSALDWIFVRGPLTFEKGAIHSDTKASDHFPLTMVIHFDPP